MSQSAGFKYKLGMFVIIGLTILVVTIYFIGKSKSLFGSTISLNAKFKNVSGLTAGNNVRFSGITIGTIKSIEFVSDSAVVVNFAIEQDVQKFIKTDARASIGSDGLMGDKVLTITPGTVSTNVIKDNATIASIPAVEMTDLMGGFKKSLDNATIITNELAIFTAKMNNNDGILSRLMSDTQFANSLTNTLSNLEASTTNFATFTQKMNNKNGTLNKLVNDEKLGQTVDSAVNNMNETVKAAQSNFLLKGYFNKKKKAAAQKVKDDAKRAKKIKDSIAKAQRKK